ncbi:MAG: hypothetical protein WCY41_00115 [Candidatus Micrarchaeia archaeon]
MDKSSADIQALKDAFRAGGEQESHVFSDLCVRSNAGDRRATSQLQEFLFWLAETDEPLSGWGFAADGVLSHIAKLPTSSFAIDDDRMIACMDKMIPQSRVNAQTKKAFLSAIREIEAAPDYAERYNLIGSSRLIDRDELASDIAAGFCEVMAKFGGKKSLDALFVLALNSTYDCTSFCSFFWVANSDIIERVGGKQEYLKRMQEYMDNKPPELWRLAFKSFRGEVDEKQDRFNFIRIFHMVDKGNVPFNERYEQFLLTQLDVFASVSIQHSMSCGLEAFSPYGGKALRAYLFNNLAILEKMDECDAKVKKAIPMLKTAIADIDRRMDERRKSAEVARKISALIPALAANAAKRERLKN